VTVPLDVVSFTVINRIYCMSRAYKLSKLLKPFCSFAGLLMSLIEDNIQFLSFRAFQQLVYFRPQPHLSFIINTFLAVGTLFLTLFCAAAMPLLMLGYCHIDFEHEWLKQGLRPALLSTVLLLGRFVNAGAHCLEHSVLQIHCLFSLNVAILALLVKWRCLFKEKAIMTIVATQDILRVLIGCFLLL
jgi:uncharacterized membrane protein